MSIDLDNLDIKILTQLIENSKKSFLEIAKICMLSAPTVKSRIERLVEIGVIRKFTIDIDTNRIGVPKAILIVNVKPQTIGKVSEELSRMEEVEEIYVASDHETVIICVLSGNIKHILSIQDRFNLTDVEKIRIMPVKVHHKK